VQGIANQLEQEKDGWAVWIHSEDELERAKDMLKGFLANPVDPKYREQAKKVEQVKKREEEEQEEAAAKYFDRERTFRTGLIYGMGAVTLLCILLSIAFTLCDTFGYGREWLNETFRFSMYRTGAPEIRNGELWRLITPIFFHARLTELGGLGVLHLFFNVLWMYSLGTVLERARGSWWLLLFVVVSAALSNTGQYLMSGPGFGGLSGVIYGLLGYIWIKGKFDPNSDLALPSQIVTMMIAWYFLCLFGFMGNIANTAHTVGALTGMAWGYLSSLQSR
jgi:GlpG protein